MESLGKAFARSAIPAWLIASVCIFMQLLGQEYYSPWLYHFCHANIFHLTLNLWALFAFRPRWFTCLVAYVISSLAAMIPVTQLAIPTIGLSGLLFAAYARRYVAWSIRPWRILGIQLVLAFVPNLNWRIHVASFAIGYIVWYGYYRCRRHR